MSSDFATMSLSGLTAAIRAKEISSRELLQTYLDRVETLGSRLNAVVTLAPERAFAEASRADELTMRGESLGPLHGVPFTVKDALETAGIRSTGGSPEMSDYVPREDATSVHRLRHAGGVLFGKTNTPIWCADIQTYNDVFGVTNNPWHLDRTTGGSSGGSAAAVAGGLTGFELGTDIGGSVRTPAHFCGVCSHKPTFGIVPQKGYIDQLGGSIIEPDVNVIGPISRAPEDLALLLEVLTCRADEPAYGWSLNLAPAEPALPDCRVGVWFSDPACPPSNEYERLLQGLANELRQAGIQVEEQHPAVDFAEQVQLWLSLCSTAGSHSDWIRTSERRVQLTQIWTQWFSSFDILLCPVWAREAFEHDHVGNIFDRTVDIDGVSRGHINAGSWLGLIGGIGLPSTVVPIGAIDGLPVGVQVIAPHLHDLRGIRAAAAIAAITGGYLVPPGF